jgi:PilZ domain
MEHERRFAKRTTPEDLSYVEFKPEGGGIILNASEEGIAFQAASPIQQSGLIRLRVSPNPDLQIELSGKIVWMDDGRKSGGLHLTEVLESTRDQIRQWLSPPSRSRTPPADFLRPGWDIQQLPELPVVSPVTRGQGPEFMPRAARGSTTRQTTAAMSVPQVLQIFKSRAFSGTQTRRKRNSSQSPLWMPSAAQVFLVLVVVFLPILLLRNVRNEIGETFIRIGEKLTANGDIQSVASSSTPIQSSPVQTSNPSSSNAASSVPIQTSPTQTSNSASSIPSESSPSQTPTPTPESAASVVNAAPKAPASENVEQIKTTPNARTARRTENSTDSRVADRHNAAQHFADPRQRAANARYKTERSEVARQLWSAVAAGDSSAELALGRLYVTGDGVPKNCEQARVLLGAASKNGSIEAQQELKKLKGKACR